MLPKLNFESAVSSKYELYNFKKWFFNNYSNTNEFNEKKKRKKGTWWGSVFCCESIICIVIYLMKK